MSEKPEVIAILQRLRNGDLGADILGSCYRQDVAWSLLEIERLRNESEARLERIGELEEEVKQLGTAELKREVDWLRNVAGKRQECIERIREDSEQSLASLSEENELQRVEIERQSIEIERRDRQVEEAKAEIDRLKNEKLHGMPEVVARQQ